MINLNFCNVLLFGILILSFCACTSVKNLTYFQKENNHSDTLAMSKPYVLKIHTGDILSIYINSLSAEASSFFNPYGVAGASGGGDGGTALSQSSAPGYLVDSLGEIEYPIIGKIRVSGLTTGEVRDVIRSKVKTYLKEPTVFVRFLNFKISLLGEVARPQVYNIPNEMITLPEAISLAGDLTLYARRDSIEIIRNENGKKIFGYVNLNTRELFNSPYFYLHANDVVYVKPSKAKAQQTDRSLQFFSLGLSLLSVLIIILRK